MCLTRQCGCLLDRSPLLVARDEQSSEPGTVSIVPHTVAATAHGRTPTLTPSQQHRWAAHSRPGGVASPTGPGEYGTVGV